MAYTKYKNKCDIETKHIYHLISYQMNDKSCQKPYQNECHNTYVIGGAKKRLEAECVRQRQLAHFLCVSDSCTIRNVMCVSDL